MKILLVITKSEIGGAQVFLLNLARSLKKMGCDVEVAAGDGNYLPSELEKNNITFHYLNSLKRNFSVLNSFYFIYDLYRLLQVNSYDIIHLNSSNTLIGAISSFFLKKRPKAIFTFHGLSFIDKNFKTNSFIKVLAKVYFKILLKAVNKTVFVSNINYIESKEARIVKSAEVIYNGLDEIQMHYLTEKDARSYFSNKCNLDLSNEFLIGSTGRLAYQKNYEFLIENYSSIKKKIPNAKVIIIGDGPDYEKYKAQILKLEIQNEFFMIGAIKDSYQYIKAFDVFTLPSRYEGLSISLIEAIFAEIPILASNVGGNPENVDHCEEQLFDLYDINDYINKLENIRRKKEFFKNYNIALKSKFSLNKMVQSYLNLYQSLIK
ncbi:MAG: glycosyltransferase [Ignavibacteriales bacterium]|nr:glycosyltransferase [Ignavibacteriales bacterium]